MTRIGGGDSFRSAGDRGRHERALTLAHEAAFALRPDNPRSAEGLARILREAKALAPEVRKQFLAAIGESFPPGSEPRLRLGEAIVRASGTDPRGMSAKALEVAVRQALKDVSRSPDAPRDIIERAPDLGMFGERTTASPPAAPLPQISVSPDMQRLREALQKERPPGKRPNKEGLLPIAGALGQLEERAALVRESLSPNEGSFRERLAARLAGPALEKVAFHAGVAQELLDGGNALAAREQLSAIREQLSELPALEGEASVAEGELHAALGRELLAQEGGLTEEDLQKVGSALPQPPPQTLWNEQFVNVVSDLGRKQGGLTEEQGARNAELARSALSERREWGAADLAAVLEQSGLALERLDLSQLQTAASYLNTATTVQDQQEKLRKALDGFQTLDRIGLPKLSRQEMVDQLWVAARVPGHALTKLKAGELEKKFQEVAQALNGGPGSAQVKIGQHTLKLELGENGEVLKTSCKKPSLLSRIGRVVNIVAPIALTVASFIPVTAPFARAASALMSAVQAVRARSFMGMASFAVNFWGVGRAALSKTGEALVRAGYGAFQAARAIRQRNWGGLVGSLASVAAAGADAAGQAAKNAGEGLGRLSGQLGRITTHLSAAAVGVGAVQSYRGASKAVSEARKALEQATASGDSRAVAAARRQLEVAERAKRGAVIGAAGAAASLGSQYSGRASLGRVSQGLSVAQAVNSKDYASAAVNALSLGATVGRSQRLGEAAQMAQSGLSLHQAQQYQTAARAALSLARDQLEAARRTGDAERIRRAEQAVREAERGLKTAAQGGVEAAIGLNRTAESIEARPSGTGATQSWRAYVATIKSGETVWEYSQRTGIPVERLLAFNAEHGNSLDPTRLRIGQSILLPTDPAEVKFRPKTEQEIRAMQREALRDKSLSEIQPPRIHPPEVPFPMDASEPRTRLLQSVGNDRELIAKDVQDSGVSLLNPTTWVDTKEEKARSESRDAFRQAVDRLEAVLKDPRSSEAQIREAIDHRLRASTTYLEARGLVERANEGADYLTPVKELVQKGQDGVHSTTRWVIDQIAQKGSADLAAAAALPLHQTASGVDLAAGVVKTVVSGVQGVAGVVAHPVQTLQGLAQLADRYHQTTFERQALEFLGEVAQGRYRTTEEALEGLRRRTDPLTLAKARLDLATDVGRATFSESIRLVKEGKVSEAAGVLIVDVLGAKGLGRLGRLGAVEEVGAARRVLEVGKVEHRLASVDNFGKGAIERGAFKRTSAAGASGTIDLAGLLKLDDIPPTGIPALDALATGSRSFGQKMDAVRRLGLDVVRDLNFTAARGEFDMATKTFTYNPQRMTRLDLAHEWRHFRQLRALEGRGLTYDSRLRPLFERGAYAYEQRLWERLRNTPTAEYLKTHVDRLAYFGERLWRYTKMSRYKPAYRGVWY